MADSREVDLVRDLARITAERDALKQRVFDLQEQLVQREAQNRRDFAYLLDADDAKEMYRKAFYRQIKRNEALEVQVERLGMELAAYKAATPEEPHG